MTRRKLNARQIWEIARKLNPTPRDRAGLIAHLTDAEIDELYAVMRKIDAESRMKLNPKGMR